jgi:hypothetical protein
MKRPETNQFLKMQSACMSECKIILHDFIKEREQELFVRNIPPNHRRPIVNIEEVSDKSFESFLLLSNVEVLNFTLLLSY